MEWSPAAFDEKLTLNIEYRIPSLFVARADYEVVEGLGAFVAYDSFLYAAAWNELPRNNRIFVRQQRVEGGIIYRFDDRLELTIAGGMALDTDFETGWDLRSTDRIAEVEDFAYIRGGLELRI